MNKLLITFLFVSTSVFLFGQELIVQSTNKNDIQLFEYFKTSSEINSAISQLKEIINKNPNYERKNMNVVVRVTFYDSNTTIFRLKRTEAYTDMFAWSAFSNTGNKITLNFDFEEQSNHYVFVDFRYIEEGGNEQVPELVANYIKEQILMKENNDKEAIIRKGINAVKNAFDRRFQQAMIDNVPPLLPQQRYYKGYTYFGFNWFNFEVTDNQNKLPYDLETLYQKDENSNYTAVPAHSVKSLLENKNTVFTFYNEGYIIVGETEISDKGESIYYEETTLLVNSNPNNIYAPVKAEILSNIHTFEELEYVPKGRNRELRYSFDSTQNALSQQHKVKVVTGTIQAEKEVNEYTGLSVFGKRFRLNQPTWCNKFARDVTKNTYKKNDYVLMDKSAAGINTDFNTTMDKYVKLPQDNDGSLWTQYINNGYLVFFSTTDHIEVGFPDNKNQIRYRERHPEDTRYPGDDWIPVKDNNPKMTIGAGSTLGYKPANVWATVINEKGESKAQAFIYLEYLKF